MIRRTHSLSMTARPLKIPRCGNMPPSITGMSCETVFHWWQFSFSKLDRRYQAPLLLWFNKYIHHVRMVSELVETKSTKETVFN